MNTNYNNNVEGALSLITINGNTYQIGKDASSSVGGIMKLYSELGNNTDGTMTQAAIKAAVEDAMGKDKVVQSGTVITATGEELNGTSGESTSAALTSGEKYIKLQIANADTTANLLYIPVNSLYKDHTVEADAAKIQLAIDANNVISADVVAGSIAKSDLTSGVQASLDLADNSKQKQTAVANIAGDTDKTLATLSQNANGEISYTMQTIQDASGSQHGLMSAAHYTKVEGIEAGAEVNIIEGVKINGADVALDANRIADLGSNYVQDASYVHTDNNYTTPEKNKLAAISASVSNDTLTITTQAAA